MRIQVARAYAALLVSSPILAGAASAATELPPPSGPYSIGRTLEYVTADDRAEIWTEDTTDKRELPLVIWYPATVADATPLADYVPYPGDKIRGGLAIERARGRALIIHTYSDVPVASGRFPVLLFSAGSGSAPTAYQALIEDIVSHGFVVVGMDHTYEGAGQILRDGRRVDALAEQIRPGGDPSTTEYQRASREHYLRRVAVRSADAATVVDALQVANEASDRRFSGKLDLDRVGAIGHSLGGVAAAHALMDVDAIRAAVNIDGHMSGMGFDDAHTPRKAFMMLEAPGEPPTDDDFARWKITREQYDSDMRALEERQAAAYTRNTVVSYRITIDAADHGNFSDDIFLMADTDGTEKAERVEIMQAARDFIVAFFEKTLLDKAPPILDAAPVGTRVEAYGGIARK